jgi:hypothetical protein
MPHGITARRMSLYKSNPAISGRNVTGLSTGRNRKKWSDALLRSFCRIVRDVSLVYEEIGFGATFLPEYRINQLTWLLQYYNG